MVIGQFYPIVGGAENQAKELSENLLKRKVAVDVLTIHRWGQKIVDKLDRINIYRVTFYSFGIIKYYLSLLEILIYVLVRGRNYACIHIHGGNEIAYWATKAAKARRIPTIVKIVNSEQRFDLSLLCQKGYNINIFIHDVSYFIATTPRIVEQLIEKSVPEKKIKLIPNGVRILEHLNNNRIIENLSENPLKIILVARLVPQKNIIFILNSEITFFMTKLN